MQSFYKHLFDCYCCYFLEPGLYTNVDMLDFGTLRTMGKFLFCLIRICIKVFLSFEVPQISRIPDFFSMEYVR